MWPICGVRAREDETVASYSRDRGARAEVEACAGLRRLGHDAHTSRSGRGGTQGGADIVCPTLPVEIEIKDQSRDALPGWLDQARAQADGRPGVCLHKRRGRARAEEWFVTMQLSDFVALVDDLRTRPIDDAEVRW